jgi:hypothetical protein
MHRLRGGKFNSRHGQNFFSPNQKSMRVLGSTPLSFVAHRRDKAKFLKLTAHLNLGLWLKVRGAVRLLLLCDFTVWAGKMLPSHETKIPHFQLLCLT